MHTSLSTLLVVSGFLCLTGCASSTVSAQVERPLAPQVYIEEDQQTGTLVPVLPYLIDTQTDTFLVGNIETLMQDTTQGTITVTYTDMQDMTPVEKTATFHTGEVTLVTPYGKCHITDTYFWCPDRSHPTPTLSSVL